MIHHEQQKPFSYSFVSTHLTTHTCTTPGQYDNSGGPVPAVLVNTSLCAEFSDMMAAAAAAAVASPVALRSKVKVPEVVNCPDGDTVTVGGQMCQACLCTHLKFKRLHHRSDRNY